MENKTEISNIISESIDKCLNRFMEKVHKTIKNMSEDETIDDYDFDIKSFVDRCAESIIGQLDHFLKKSSKSSKSKKDPNAPKKPRSAYILFSSDNRSDVKGENPELSTTEITKEIARLWREADSDVKEEYKQKAEEDKKRYQSEMEISDPESQLVSEKKKKKEKDPNAPKKPCSAYILFSSDNRKKAKEENPDLSNVDLTRKLAEMWKECDKKTKIKYETKAEQDKTRYETEMSDYNKENFNSSPKKSKETKSKSKEESPKQKSKKSKEESPKLDESKKEPKKKSANPFMNFVSEKRPIVASENPDAKPHEITKMVADLWKELSEEEKAEYKL